jgi:C4-dicarboxylate-specific signal transduction histidine kinase
MFFSLKNKLTIFVILTILTGGGIASFFIFQYSKSALIERSENSVLAYTEKQAEEINQILNFGRYAVSSVSTDSDILGLLEKSVGKKISAVEAEDFSKHLELYNIGGIFSAIYIMDAAGLTLASTDRTFINNNYGFRNYFTEAIAGRNHIEAAVGVTSKKLGYYLSGPVKSADEKIIGAAVVKIKPEIVHNLISAPKTFKSNHIMLADSNGIILYSDDQNRVYQSLGEMTDAQKKEVGEKRLFESMEIKPRNYAMIQKKLDSIKEPVIYNLYDEDEKRQEIISIGRVSDLPFLIAIDEDYKEITAEAVRIAIVLIMFLFGTAVVMSVITYLLITITLRPLTILQKAAIKVKEGDLNQKVAIKTDDEIQSLGETFNEMIVSVRESRKKIEQQVEERTRQLKKAIDELQKNASSMERLNKLTVGRELKMMELKKDLKKIKEQCKIK